MPRELFGKRRRFSEPRNNRGLKRVPLAQAQPIALFLNIRYNDRFRRLYLAYIVGLSQLGLQPRATLGIPGGERPLDRILALIQSYRYSIHDLPRVETDRIRHRLPASICPANSG